MLGQDYVKKGKLIVLVESNDFQARDFESKLVDAGYRGTIKIFNDIERTVQFLNVVVSEDGLLAAADLLFFSFDIHQHDL